MRLGRDVVGQWDGARCELFVPASRLSSPASSLASFGNKRARTTVEPATLEKPLFHRVSKLFGTGYIDQI